VGAGDVSGSVREQKHDRFGNFGRLGDALHGDAGRVVRQLGFRIRGAVELGEEHRRLRRSRADRVHPDAPGRQLGGGAARHRQDRSLGGGVGDVTGLTHDRQFGGGVDDGPCAAALHDARGLPQDVERAGEVGVHKSSKDVVGRVGQWTDDRNAGVVVDGVDGAQLGFDAAERATHRGRVRDVGAEGNHLAAVRFHAPRRGIQVVVGP
jgi:hypothetical protein